MKRNPKIFSPIVFVLLAPIACSTFAPATAAPTPTSAPTSTAVPLYQQVRLAAVPSEEDGQSPDHKITAQTPTLNGSDDPRVQTFNKETGDFVQGLIADYKKNLAAMGTPPLAATSYFDVRYALVSPPGNILSLKYQTEGYIAGMAHPYHQIYSFTYDLEAGRDIALGDLFLPNSNYLQTISTYCAAQLSTRDIDFKDFSGGADPTADHYKNWNITPDGLMITFDEYQVAAYVAGPQTVTVPYGELKSLTDPDGPLEPFVR